MASFVEHVIGPLAAHHDVSVFDCGEPWLNNYLRQHAAANQRLGYGRTYAATPAASPLVEGYYTVAMGSVVFQNLPDPLAIRVPRYPMPVVHLGCLAVDCGVQGLGLGDFLLIDAFRRAVAAADVVAARALDVKAISDRARNWYLDRGFLPFRDNPDHLYLPMDTVRMVAAKA